MTPDYNACRVRPANEAALRPGHRFVLYWMQAFRRLRHNHALDHALRWCRELKKPLVVYEGLKLGYPWAGPRHHRFILEGMRANARAARRLGVNHWPFVETPEASGRGLLRELAAQACLVVTDDYPAFVVPGQTRALAGKVDVAVHAVDGNGVVPLARLGEAASAASHFRRRVHREFAEAWRHRAAAEPDFPRFARRIDPPFAAWDPECDLDSFLAGLPLDPTVPAVRGVEGGSEAGRAKLEDFVSRRLPRYAADRNAPDSPERGAASGLSPYLHYGHVAAQEVAEVVLNAAGPRTPEQIDPSALGKREGFFGDDPNTNAFLDEAITWRDLGYHWHFQRGRGEGDPSPLSLENALPGWAWATLRRHAGDRREHLYSPEEFEAAATHDPLWNAAQRELVIAGRIHNYLRMLWGKKVLEWSASPEEAYRTLEHLNNKYALDGRDPNSYSGILWCFGLFDRPWLPERPVLGTVRYLSSANAARKFRPAGYLDYVAGLGG